MFYIRHKSFTKRFASVYIILILVLFTFLGGAFFGYRGGKQAQISPQDNGGKILNKEQQPPYLLENVDFKLFWEVWSMMKDKYLEQPITDARLFYGALTGMVASVGDPYTAFLDPETTGKFNSELAGTFDGIGAEIGIKKDQLLVVAPLPGTPAEKAGLRPGDRILAIDSKDTTGMAIDYAVSIIRGQKGTSVVLKIWREGWEQAKDITINRETIHIDSVTWKMLDNNIAQIKLVQFNGETTTKFETAVQEILLKNPKGIILDMRSNPGGYFDSALAVASFWIPAPQTVVIQKTKGNRQQKFPSFNRASLKNMPTIVLVNNGTASGAEIVAGALQDYGKAKLVGEKTFGKGSVQDYAGLNGGSSIKITVAEWLTPKERHINKEGIAPDIEIKLTKEDYEADKDPQLEKAIELLK